MTSKAEHDRKHGVIAEARRRMTISPDDAGSITAVAFYVEDECGTCEYPRIFHCDDDDDCERDVPPRRPTKDECVKYVEWLRNSRIVEYGTGLSPMDPTRLLRPSEER